MIKINRPAVISFTLALIFFMICLQGCVMLGDDDSDDEQNYFINFEPDSADIPPNSFYISLANAVDDVFTISVSVKEIEDLYGTAFTLTWDPTLMLYLDSSEGGFLRNSGMQTSFIASLEQNYPGRLVVGYTILGQSQGVTGSGLVCNVTFKALRQGESSLRFINPSGIDSSGDTIVSVNWLGGILKILLL